MSLKLRPATLADAPALAQIYAQPAVVAQTLAMPWPDLALWEQRLDPTTLREGDLRLVAQWDGQVAGSGHLVRATRARRSHTAAVALMVDSALQGRGIGRALFGALLEHADRWLDVSRLELEVAADNTRAIAIYEAAGFVREGLHRGYQRTNGVLVDVIPMARVRG